MSSYDYSSGQWELGTSSAKLRIAFVDEKLLAQEFRTDDHVRKTGLRDFVITPYIGRVLYSNTDTGVISVQWPWGVENNSPSELLLDRSDDFMPPQVTDQSYSTYESDRWKGDSESAKEDAKWRKSLASLMIKEYENITMPVYRSACKALYEGHSEMDALSIVSSVHSNQFGFEVVRRTVSNLYNAGRRFALYWASGNRKYRQTKSEKAANRMSCPRCHSVMKPRVYRHNKRISQCRACGFSIHSKDIIK